EVDAHLVGGRGPPAGGRYRGSHPASGSLVRRLPRRGDHLERDRPSAAGPVPAARRLGRLRRLGWIWWFRWRLIGWWWLRRIRWRLERRRRREQRGLVSCLHWGAWTVGRVGCRLGPFGDRALGLRPG